MDIFFALLIPLNNCPTGFTIVPIHMHSHALHKLEYETYNISGYIHNFHMPLFKAHSMITCPTI
jgi:hypothetical protein